MPFTAVTWSSGDRATVDDSPQKFEAMDDRDEWVKAKVEDHDHDGSNSDYIDYGEEQRRGSVRFYSHGLFQVSGSSTADIYLTDDLTSGGANVFDPNVAPTVFVRKSTSSGAYAAVKLRAFSDEGVGHDGASPSGNTGNTEYHSELLLDGSSKWFVRIHNNETQIYQYVITAFGKGP